LQNENEGVRLNDVGATRRVALLLCHSCLEQESRPPMGKIGARLGGLQSCVGAQRAVPKNVGAGLKPAQRVILSPPRADEESYYLTSKTLSTSSP